MSMVNVKQAVESPGLAFERMKYLDGNTFGDKSTIVLMPGRDQFVHQRVFQSVTNMIPPMNNAKAFFYVAGDEVGHAYNKMIETILNDPVLSKWKYVMTVETDNIQPADAHIRLLESIEMAPRFDAVSGLYWTKGDYNMPMAYGDPAEYERTGVLDFRPRDVRSAVEGGRVMPVNGIAMGCALWRLDLFRQIPAPWFVTVADVVPGLGVQAFTQDLWFCKRAREAGKKFAVDMRVLVGHMDLKTGMLARCDRCGAVVFRWDAYDSFSAKILNESAQRGGPLVGTIDRCHECCVQVQKERTNL